MKYRVLNEETMGLGVQADKSTKTEKNIDKWQ